jgi:membrane-bound lytic murein transglycosylase D
MLEMLPIKKLLQKECLTVLLKPWMRLGSMIMLTLTLTACASTNSDWLSGINQDPRASDASKVSQSRNAARAPRVNLDKDSVGNLNAPYSDLWDRIREGFVFSDSDSPLVIKHVRYYSERPDYVDRMMSRSSRYLFYIVEEVERRNMPMELALLPFIESAFNPEAFSRAKASGMWQFMPATGKHFQLSQNVFRDERRDVIQSTDAALDYLQRLYKMFGNWELALAAYNWGEGNVSKAIKRNQAKRLPTDYKSLKMPDETRNYVPKLLAIKKIVSDPKAYGLNLPVLENHPYFVIVTTSKDIDVELAAEFARMTLPEFKAMNPSFNKPVILGASEPQILLPFGRAESFEENLKSFEGPLATWTAVKLGSRETVDNLAQRLNVDANQVREVNAIPRGMRIKPGSTVIIPKNEINSDVPMYLANSGSLMLEKDIKKVANASGAKTTNTNTKAKNPKNNNNTAKKSNSSNTQKKTTEKSDTQKSNKKPSSEAKVAQNSKKPE